MEPVYGGAWGVGAKNHFHIGIARRANTALVAPCRIVMGAPDNRRAIRWYPLGGEEPLAHHLVDKESFEDVSAFLAGRLEFGDEANCGERPHWRMLRTPVPVRIRGPPFRRLEDGRKAEGGG